eukprot:364602-Chlamydomonas_euryale.AAC.17
MRRPGCSRNKRNQNLLKIQRGEGGGVVHGLGACKLNFHSTKRQLSTQMAGLESITLRPPASCHDTSTFSPLAPHTASAHRRSLTPRAT